MEALNLLSTLYSYILHILKFGKQDFLISLMTMKNVPDIDSKYFA